MFARAYFADPTHNGTKAAIAAGYSENSATQEGSRLLRRADVQELLEKFRRAASEKYEITADKVLKELALLSFANMQDFIDGKEPVPIGELTREQAAAIQEFVCDADGSVKLKLSNKREALELLGKHLRLFGSDDHGASGVVNNIVLNVPFFGRAGVPLTDEQVATLVANSGKAGHVLPPGEAFPSDAIEVLPEPPAVAKPATKQADLFDPPDLTTPGAK
jgi:phage terminase small subunit